MACISADQRVLAENRVEALGGLDLWPMVGANATG
jgi:hypothetical protein